MTKAVDEIYFADVKNINQEICILAHKYVHQINHT